MARSVYGFIRDIGSADIRLVDETGADIGVEELTSKDEITLFVPGVEVSVFSVLVPSKSQVEARRAAPFAVEDDIAVSVDEAHFALGSVGRDVATDDVSSPRALHVVASQTMDMWVQKIKGMQHLERCKLVAEHSVLNAGEIFLVGDHYVGNIEGRSFAFEASMPDDVIKLLVGAREPVSVSKLDFLKILAARTAQARCIDLRQGEFQHRTRKVFPSLKAWRLSAGLACVLALSWLGYMSLETRALRAETRQLQAGIETAYAGAFPDAPKPRNYARAVARAVKSGAGGEIAFRDASAALYAALGPVDEAQLLSLRYNDGELVATIAYRNYGDDGAVKAALTDAGFAADLGDARQESVGVVGDVTLRLGAP